MVMREWEWEVKWERGMDTTLVVDFGTPCLELLLFDGESEVVELAVVVVVEVELEVLVVYEAVVPCEAEEDAALEGRSTESDLERSR